MVYVWDLIVKQKWQSTVSSRGRSCACPCMYYGICQQQVVGAGLVPARV